MRRAMDAIRGDRDTAEYPATGCFLAGRLRSKLSAADRRYVEELVEDIRCYEDGEVLVRAGDVTTHSTILIDGFMFRTIERHARRYIVGTHVAGDFVDLHGFALKRLDHNLTAAGPIRVGLVPHARLRKTMEERPDIARAMWFATLLDAAVHRKWIQILEQLDAPQRIAHHYAELRARLELVGRSVPRALRTPFTQLDLADMCGVSAIHANRAVGKLREQGIAEIRRGDLYTSDWGAVERFAQFDPSYLYGEGPLKMREEWE